MVLEASEVPEPAWFLDPPPLVVLTEADVATQLQPRQPS
jgi:hypothetical protein